jgi:hypothetical protein
MLNCKKYDLYVRFSAVKYNMVHTLLDSPVLNSTIYNKYIIHLI